MHLRNHRLAATYRVSYARSKGSLKLPLGGSMKRIAVCLAFLVLAGCGGTRPLDYSPRPMQIESAEKAVERYVMTQHPAWKPDDFVAGEDYMGWNFGSVATGQFVGTAIGNVAVGSSTGQTRVMTERVYYDEIAAVKMYSWMRKGQQWYLVSALRDNGQVIKHILRTRSENDAKTMTDALAALVAERRVRS